MYCAFWSWIYKVVWQGDYCAKLKEILVEALKTTWWEIWLWNIKNINDTLQAYQLIQVKLSESLRRETSTPLKDYHKMNICAFWTYTIYLSIVQVNWRIFCGSKHPSWRRPYTLHVSAYVFKEEYSCMIYQKIWLTTILFFDIWCCSDILELHGIVLWHPMSVLNYMLITSSTSLKEYIVKSWNLQSLFVQVEL